ncbi:MAG: hypothetical protein GT600_15205 [Bacteroidales bacterium]|jgi:hypothetical protein|nr:hypothetical protein [Bacteroidales bacterium]NLH78580.1 hypothetical protein [Acidobacteriota bacterium]OQB59759.1 MAG: hypothetical protein BWX96_02575 [Bacteroidetes bacterium ADurb.Bin145]HOU03313.1 hypothetical protein [Bacteroidales bacterium]HQK69231.1 hypothetical protein [Bacteroidales bacterium]
MSAILNSSSGGYWQSGFGGFYYTSQLEAYINGCFYNETHNSWSHTKQTNWYTAITLGLLSRDAINDSMTASLEDGPGDGGKKPILGLSVDFALAIASLGYTIEGGFYTDGKASSQFFSHGQTFGVEASAGFNFILIKPKNNFEFSDLEGMGTSGVINFWILSISVLGNSSPSYPTNSVFDTYWGIKIGIGPGAGGSYSPSSNTFFHDWIPDFSKSFFNWK